MKKILISWVSDYHDFEKPNPEKSKSTIPEVNLDGPSFDLHRYFVDQHELHVLLSTKPSGAIGDIELQKQLSRGFSDRRIELRGLGIEDPTDYQVVYSHMIRLLDEFEEQAKQIDIMFTTGLSAMRLAMAFAHLSHPAPTRLIQGKDPRFTGGRGEFEELQLRLDDSLRRLYVKVGAGQAPAEDFYLADALKPIYEKADKVAQIDGVTALLLGPSGSGKEYLARYIHKNSARHKKPFVAVNCASLNDELLQSTLFGHKKGSFSHATEDQEGFFQAAHGGVLFLDEIGDISPKMQQSLLRALQEKEVIRTGETKATQVDIRIIAATNKDLDVEMQTGRFRKDLYFRLNAVELFLPSLKDYPIQDLKAFIEFFMRTKAAAYNQLELKLSDAAWQLLLSYDFPGNLRQLEQVISHFYVFAEREVRPKDFPPKWEVKNESNHLSVDSVLARHIQRVLDMHNGDLTKSSEALCRSVNTIKSKIEKYGLRHRRNEEKGT